MGKYSILIVFCLAVMLAIILPNIHSLGHRAVENFVGYAVRTQSHNLAVSGANALAAQFYLNPKFRTDGTKAKMDGGTFTASVQDAESTRVKIQSVGTLEGVSDTVEVLLQPGSFARYAYYSKVEGSITWITGDTVWGPFHTQDVMKTSGKPVYLGPVTNLKGTNPSPSSAKFDAGYLTNVSVDLPLDLSYTATGATRGGKIFPAGDVYLTFLGDDVEWKTAPGGTSTIEPIKKLTSNGVILAQEGSFHVKGVVDGRVTLCALGDKSDNNGNIYIDDDIRYANDPRKGQTDNILGLIAENSVIIEENSANNDDVVIQGSIFCRTGGLTADNYGSRPVSGILDLLGGVIQYQRGAVGTFSSSSGTPVIKTGFRKSYKYDTRFYLDSPPYYPWTGGYQIVSWVE